ncbi:SAM-dependent methyltransferase [Streptomyces sp. NPDC050658]|uniref:SAM-dependent methyltransferase n=1 Tax=unclassified Streptomyces TaxID=2593676 RepID=UPI00341BF7FE
MALEQHGAHGTTTAPTPEEVGTMYDRFGDLLAMTLGSTAVHIGMYASHDAPTPVTTLTALADLAQDRQTDFLVDTIGLAAHEHLLDIGCGTGGPAVALAARSGGRVTGITVSRSQLASCQARLTEPGPEALGLADRVDFAYGNAMELAYGDATFDAAWSIDCLPHLSDRPAGLREALRVLRPGGRFLFTEFALRGTPTDEEVAAYTRMWTCPPLTPFAKLLAEIEEAGFRVETVRNRTADAALCGELMCVLYEDRRGEIGERFGKEALAYTDPLMVPYRSFCRNHMDYYQLVVRKPEK